MKKTSLTEVHIKLGAKMVPFAGYNMPVSYTGINDEHLTVRNGVGVFDVSHMGEFILKGDKALNLIQYLTTNDASKLVEGKVQYTCFPKNTGGIIDDLLLYCLDKKSYMLVVNASNIEKDWNWIVSHNSSGVEMHNISDKTTLLAVQGPAATKVLQKLTDMDLSALKYYTFAKGKFGGHENVLVSATGYTGAGGFELYFDNNYAIEIWNKIFESGAEYGIKPIGLAARDTLRLEMGFCLYGNDIDESTSPIEAGLGWITKFNKEFINFSELLKQKENGTENLLIGFELLERGIPRHGYRIINEHRDQIGRVTSGTRSPSLKKSIGLGYVSRPFTVVGMEIFIEIRDEPVRAKVVGLPFYTETT